MDKLALAAAAVAFPCLVIFGGIVTCLRQRRPPIHLKGVAPFLGLGFLAIVLGEIWNMAADRWLLGRVNFGFYYAFLTAALPEEGFRFLAILYGLKRRPQVSLVSAMLLGGVVGLTFATYEHISYAILSGWDTWLARSFTSVPYHTLSGAIHGYAAAAFLRTRQLRDLGWLAVLIVVHGLADWPLDDPTSKEPETLVETFIVSGWAGNAASLFVAAVMATVLMRRAMRTEVTDATTR